MAAIVVGVLVAIQSKINAGLAAHVGSGFVAAAVSFGTGLVLAMVIVLSRQPWRQAVGSIPALVRQGSLRWWQLLGGLGGAWLVTTQGLVVVVVGVTIFTVGVVAGQVGGSLVVDRAGLSPAGTLPITAFRVVAAGLALAAVAVSGVRAGDLHLHVSWVVLLAVSAGLGIAVQQAINGRVAVATRQPLAATLTNFVVGFSGLLLVCVVGVTLGLIDVGEWPTEWWWYLGGPIGVLFIALAAWAVHALGVLVFGLLSIAGQLLGSVLIDTLAPTGDAALGWPQWLGLVLVAAAVLLAQRR
ncbi:MAG: DMT family transporter [Candidatus Nanopelagicales bacterium]